MVSSRTNPSLTAARHFFDTPSAYLAGNTTIPARVTLLRQALAGNRFQEAVELGCGDGSIGLGLLHLSSNLVLVDISPRMIDEARRRTPDADRDRVAYCVGDAASYDPGRKFDLVLCIGVIAHVESVKDLVSSLARLTARNGLLVIQITDSDTLWARIARLAFDGGRQPGYATNETTAKELIGCFERHGMRLERTITYSDVGFGLERLRSGLASRFKAFTGSLGLHRLLSEKLILLRKHG